MNTAGCVKRESERRFLLQRLPSALPEAKVFGIRQFYTARDPARYYAIRFRRVEDLHSGAVNCIETHKIGTGMDVISGVYDPGTAASWKERIAEVARKERPEVPFDDVALSVTLKYLMPRPKSLMRPKDPEGRIPCTKRPDLDNLDKVSLGMNP